MGMGGQTMVTVELTKPVRFVRPLGKEAEAQVLRFYADNPTAAVAAREPLKRLRFYGLGQPQVSGSSG
jgi:hypothetical protein